MVVCTGEQDIPAEWLYAYEGTLKKSMSPRRWSGKRYPWRLWHMRSGFGNASPAQEAVRAKFLQSVACFNCQPQTGPIPPPFSGARGRNYWFAEAVPGGLWYFDYFMQQTIPGFDGTDNPNWCKAYPETLQYTDRGAPTVTTWNWKQMEVGMYTGYERWIWVNRTEQAFNHLWIKLQAHTYWGHMSKWVNLRVYEAGGAWTKSTLTWNSQPARGNELVTYPVLIPETGNPIIKIPLPKDVQRLIICMDDIDNIVLGFYVRRSDVDFGFGITAA